MLFRNKKGQGALEYLLLIGGAVLIAVIVIALLVGMGGGARESAQDQADRAGDTLDHPQAGIITQVVANYDDCDIASGNDTNTLFINTINWTAIGEGGTHTLFIVDSHNKELYKQTDVDPRVSNIDVNLMDFDTNEVDGIDAVDDLENIACRDTHFAYIETEKNNIVVTSNRRSFSWTN